MIKSMTGYGRASVEVEGKAITVEIRALNSKQLDLNARIPLLLKNFENEIRSMVAKELLRAKADLNIIVENHSATSSVSINQDLAKSYYETLSELSSELNNPVSSDIFLHVLRMPDVISSPQEEANEELWNAVKNTILEACHKLDEFRISEGKVLEEDFVKRINLINNMIDEVTPFEESRIVKIREKFEKSLSELSPKIQYDPNRLEQEIFFYLEKLDVTEEKVRLRKHCKYFIDTLKENDANGKKLGFIVQECGREINTLGSKSNDFDIQQIVVRMKDELEKLKEQLANIL